MSREAGHHVNTDKDDDPEPTDAVEDPGEHGPASGVGQAAQSNVSF
jgi:hypothetical protein